VKVSQAVYVAVGERLSRVEPLPVDDCVGGMEVEGDAEKVVETVGVSEVDTVPVAEADAVAHAVAV